MFKINSFQQNAAFGCPPAPTPPDGYNLVPFYSPGTVDGAVLIGEIALYSCKENHFFDSDFYKKVHEIECQPDGTWSGQTTWDYCESIESERSRKW